MPTVSGPMVESVAAQSSAQVSSTTSYPELTSATYLTALSPNLPPPHPAPTRPIPALPESPTCPSLITPWVSVQKSRKTRIPEAAGNGHKRKSSLQGGGILLSAPVVAERKMLGGRAAGVRLSMVYGNNVLVEERKSAREKERESPGIVMVTKMDSVLGRVSMAQMSPLPPVPKIPAALAGRVMLMTEGKGGEGNGLLALHTTGSTRESLVSLHSTVNGPLPEYFDDTAAVAVLKIDNTNLVPQGHLSQKVAPTMEDEVGTWAARRPQETEMRRTHAVRSRSASMPGKIRARMPSTVPRGSSRRSTLSSKSHTPRSIHRTMSSASRKSNLSAYGRETSHGTPRTGIIRTSLYIGGTTPKSASVPFNVPPIPPLQAPIASPLQPPPLAVSVVENTRRKKARKAKPARIMLPQEILAIEARRESRRDEMRMLAEKQETVMRPIQEAETSCSSEKDNDSDGFRTETDSENVLHQVKFENVVAHSRGNASSTILRVAVAASPAPAAPLLARKATPRPTRKPAPSTSRGNVYSIFPTSPRRGSRGELVFPPPILPGTVYRQDSGLKPPGMTPSSVPISPPGASAAKPEVPGGPTKPMRRRHTSRKSTIVSPTPNIGYTNGGIGSAFAENTGFDFNVLPLGIALTPLKVPVVVTPRGEIVAEISGNRSDLIIGKCEEKQGHGKVAAMGVTQKESVRVVEGVGEVEEEKELISIMNRPRPKKPQGRPATRGRSTAGRGHQESQFGASVSATFYNGPEDEEAFSEPQRRRPKYDSEIYTLLSRTPSPACSAPRNPSTVEVDLADDPTHLNVASIARSSLPDSLRDSFYEELRLKYSDVAFRLSSDLASEEEEFVGGVLHMGTPPLDSDGESDEGSSLGGSPPLPPPGTPLKPLRIQKGPTMPMAIQKTNKGVAKAKETAETLQRMSAVGVAELELRRVAESEAPQVATAVVMKAPAPVVVPVQRQQTLRKPAPVLAATTNSGSKTLPPTTPQSQNTNLPLFPHSTSRATINPAVDNSSSSSSYGLDPNEAFAALQMRTGDPFYSPTSKKTPQPAFPALTPNPVPPRPAPQAPTQPPQRWQPNMLPGMPKRRVELPRFTRTIRHTPAPAPTVPVRETPFFLDVRTPGSKTVYSSSPPLKQEEIPTLLARGKFPAVMEQSSQALPGAPPVPALPENYCQTADTRPRAATHSGAPPPIPIHSYPPPPVPPIPRNIPIPIPTTSGPLPPLPPRNYESVMYLNRNSDPISAMNGNEHVLSHYTPGTLITVPNASSPKILHRVDAHKMGGHWRSTSSGDDTGQGSNATVSGTARHTTNATVSGTARHTMKVRLEKAFKIGTDRHGIVELGQGEFGGNFAEGLEDNAGVKKEGRKHASKPSFGGWGTRLKSGVFGAGGQGHIQYICTINKEGHKMQEAHQVIYNNMKKDRQSNPEKQKEAHERYRNKNNAKQIETAKLHMLKKEVRNSGESNEVEVERCAREDKRR
ncbi:hypothetical protein EV426DRAFT_704916 [Tirmania nivea]|nr:hypothetical protein EV426DRAFT_704916 [Tirmania nivea]